jgi:ABC-type transporter Mla subunit MlaD
MTPPHSEKDATLSLIPTLRHRILILGAATGTAGAVLTLALAAWLGIDRGASLGILLAAIAGAAGTFTTLMVFERLVRDHLAAVDESVWGIPGQEPDPIGEGALNDTLGLVRQSLKRARELEAESEEIGRIARTFWVAVHAKSGSPPPAPETRACVAAFFEMFRQTADTLVRYSSSLEEANERMASGAVDQSETVSRTTTTVEALSDKIDRISQNAENATEACERTRQEARLGLEQVHRVIEGMDRLRSQIDVNGRKARRLGDRSVEIGTIVELIRGISSRTDMLALNATIESVRAGEHGRGFAVVAEEIRKLAERTATATRDIGTLVEAIQADSHESIRALGEEQSEMEQEAQRVRETGAALERISKVAEQSAQLVDGISRSTNDQVVAAQELVRAMQRISDVSHVTLERTTRSRESIRGLSQWCDRLEPLSSLDILSTNLAAPEEIYVGGSALSPRRNRRLAGTERTR